MENSASSLSTDTLKVDNPTLHNTTHSGHVIAITSGKGGVGKTNITTNLGIALAMQGEKVCIFDADTNLANINILLGITPKYTLEHFLIGEKTINEIIIDGPYNVKIIPAASGIAECVELNEQQKQKLVSSLEELEESFDYLLIDTAAGIENSVLNFVQSAQYSIIVISPEPTSLTDAFALIRVLKKRGMTQPIYILVNMVKSFDNSIEVYRRFDGAVKKYLQIQVSYLGYITTDEELQLSVSKQQPVIMEAPESTSSRCFHTLAEGLKKQLATDESHHCFSNYWKEISINQGLSASSQTDDKIISIGDKDISATNSFTALSKGIQELSQRKDTSENELETLIQSLITLFYNKFSRLPFDTHTSLIQSLKKRDYPEKEILDLIETLKDLYKKNYPTSLSSADIEHKELQADNDTENEQAALLDLINKEDFNNDRFTSLVQTINEIYQQRFGSSIQYKEQRLLDQYQAITDKIDACETSLQESIARMSDCIDETVEARRDYLKSLDLIDRCDDKSEQ